MIVCHDAKKAPDTRHKFIFRISYYLLAEVGVSVLQRTTLVTTCEPAARMTQSGPRTSAWEQSGRALVEEQPPGPTPVLRSGTGNIMMI